MRLSNYLTDIDWQLRDTLYAIRELEPLHKISEQNLQRAENEVKSRRVALFQAETRRDDFREKFRDVHEALCKLKSRAGELQGERFDTAEEEDDWLSKHA